MVQLGARQRTQRVNAIGGPNFEHVSLSFQLPRMERGQNCVTAPSSRKHPA